LPLEVMVVRGLIHKLRSQKPTNNRLHANVAARLAEPSVNVSYHRRANKPYPSVPWK